MKRIGIVTIIDYNNYGNRLQNFAVQELLRRRGFHVQTLRPRTNQLVKSSMWMKVKKIKEFSIHDLYFRITSNLEKKKYNKNYEQKINAMREFSNNYIEEVNVDNIASGFEKDFSYFICGSDQVWNPLYINDNGYFFLDFTHKDKKISLSASFGVSELNNEFKSLYADFLKDFRAISVRESQGEEIIKGILPGKDVVLLLDPTMLIEKDIWINLCESINDHSEKYIFIYSLGRIEKQIMDNIINFANVENLKIIDIMNIKSNEYCSGPIEFINLIKNASLVITDSFHGTVFSILFETPFYVFDRYLNGFSLSSRISTLLAKFNFEDRKYSGGVITSNALKMDTTNIDEILKNERKKVDDFLNQNMRD